jgi:2-iminobutanoate/2-iminopropanoate deaminase
MKKVVRSDGAPAAVGPYSQAISSGNLIFCSGQLGLDPATGRLAGGSAKEQVRRCLLNLEAVLTAAGLSMSDVVKTTIFLVDMEEFKDVNEVYAAFFDECPPARSTVGVSSLPLGARVEVEAIAFRR